jgi:hypothetical protein
LRSDLSNPEKYRWIGELKAINLQPVIEQIELVEGTK